MDANPTDKTSKIQEKGELQYLTLTLLGWISQTNQMYNTTKEVKKCNRNILGKKYRYCNGDLLFSSILPCQYQNTIDWQLQYLLFQEHFLSSVLNGIVI